jgi:hypothetical protein
MLCGLYDDANDSHCDTVTFKTIVILVTVLCRFDNVSISDSYGNDDNGAKHDDDDDDDDDDKLKNGRQYITVCLKKIILRQ